MRPLRISYTLPVYWPAIGGCELHTHELVKRLSEKHKINVITLIDNQKDKLSHELWFACILNARNHPVEYPDNKAKVSRLPLKLIEKCAYFPLVRIQSTKLPDGLINAALEKLSDFYMKKIIQLAKDSDLIHCVHGGVSYFGYAALKAARRLDIPFIYTPVLHLYHKNWLGELRKSRTDKARFVYNPKLYLSPRGWTDHFWYKICTEADTLISMTDFEKEFFVLQGVPAEKIHRIGVGPLTEEDSTEDVRRKYALEDKKVVLFLGRNVVYKGIEELLLAAKLVWKDYPDTFFVFAGPVEGEALKIFPRYSDPRIKVLGYVPDDEKSGLLKACDIFCMPSLEESLGGTFLEAWTFGKPIIGAKIPPLIELTKNGEGGYLVDPDPSDIAEKIMILLKDPERGKSMGLWGKRRVSEQYSWEVITEKMEDIYRKTIK